MTDMTEVLKKLKALDESEVSEADQVILEFCFNAIKVERENWHKQEIRFSAVLQALGRHLGVNEEDLEEIYIKTNNYINDHWDEISKTIEDDQEFARIISGITKDHEHK